VKTSRAKFTPELARRIRAFCRKIGYPHSHDRYWNQQRIGDRFNVTAGRVSEALHGKRDAWEKGR
jgi:hypothetical protein